MKCLYCNCQIGKVPDNGLCPNCGGVLPEKCYRHTSDSQKVKFCPKCGKNCEEFWFCQACGTQLGLPGAMRKRKVFPTPPVGIYRYGNNYIQMDRQSLKIYRKAPYQSGGSYLRNRHPITRVIKYSEIMAVSFLEPKGLKPGALSIRDKIDPYTPFPTYDTAYEESCYDSGTVFFGKANRNQFCKLFFFLKQCADIVNWN